MKRTTLTLVIFASLLFGATLGALGGYRHAEQRQGAELLAMLHKDAKSNLQSYERIKQLVETDDRARLLSYLDSVMHTEATVLESTRFSASDSQLQ